VKWLVDAQLPQRFGEWRRNQGEDVLHSIELPVANRTNDQEICRIADHENRIVVTKDRDFFDSFWVAGAPKKLVYFRLGNITNRELLAYAVSEFPKLQKLMSQYRCVEWTRHGFIVHA
jgi:predicted nuclease of predicted toxin-antitoxin system